MSAPKQINQYVLMDEIARGGQGIVYLGRHVLLGHQVAIKILLDADPMNVKRFKQEAKVLARIRHPNLLQVIDFGEFSDPVTNFPYPYMVMEFVKGQSLRDIIHRQGIPDFDWTLKTITPIAEVLDLLHQQGIVHRDLKPNNILLEAGTNRPVLIDFGLIKRDTSKFGLESLDRSKLSISGEIIGTPEYMAPEQVDKQFGDIGPWTDVYGLGATLFYLLTKETPYKGNPLAIFSKIMQAALDHNAPPNPKHLNPRIPNALANAVMAAMISDPSQRPQNMEEFLNLLKPPAPKRKFPLRVFAGGTAFAALVGIFIAQGISRPQAEKLAAQKIQEAQRIKPEPPAPIKSNIPANTETFTRFTAKIRNLFENKKYIEVLEMCDSGFIRYPEQTDNYTLYAMKASAAIGLAVDLKKNGTHDAQLFEQAEFDSRRALELLPDNAEFEQEKTFLENIYRTARRQNGKQRRYRR